MRAMGAPALCGLVAGVAVTVSCARQPVPDSVADAAAREQMIARQLRGRDIDDERVLAAMAAVPRHAFVPADARDRAYGDHALPIGHGQTISQPYVVALMSTLLDVQPGDRILEIGTGSGYQAAVLAQLAAEVYTIEINSALAERARNTLTALGYERVHVRAGDGSHGWPEAAPFDAIIITAATPKLPDALIGQLRDGGRVVAPLEQADGDGEVLAVGIKRGDAFAWTQHGGVRFVPMVGEVRRTPS